MQQSLRTQPGHGGNLTWAASLAGCSPLDILDFSASISPLGPPQSAIDAIQSHLIDLPHYPDPNYTSLRQALAQIHHLSPDWILAGNGSAELLTWASRELADLEATYLITPAFGDYLRALRAFNANVIQCLLPLPIGTNSEIRVDSSLASLLAKQFTNQQASEIQRRQSGLLINNPHNPTGKLFQVDDLLPLLEQFALIVIDEAFMDFLPPAQQQSLIDRIADFPNLIILRSLTKFYTLAGLRLGYAIAHPDRLTRWQQWRDPWSVNVLAVAAAEAVLQDTQFQQQTWNWLPSARNQLFEGLKSFPGLHPLPGAANYLLVQSNISTVELQHRLLKQSRILIRDCMSFPDLGDRFFRVAVRTTSDNEKLLRGLATALVDE